LSLAVLASLSFKETPAALRQFATSVFSGIIFKISSIIILRVTADELCNTTFGKIDQSGLRWSGAVATDAGCQRS
jgi:hypothetical protein